MWFVLALLACTAREPPAHPNILVITLDTTRADRLGSYGYHRDTSPHLDRLAERAIVFEDFIVPMATTLPTHLSVFTGTHPLEHGVLANVKHGGDRFVTSPTLRTFAEYLTDVGYQTAAFVSAAPLKRGTGVEEGFAHFSQPDERTRTADQTTAAVVRHLARWKGRRPHFTWVHYFDPHAPLEPPEPFASRFGDDPAQRRWIAERAMVPSERPGGFPLDPLRHGNLYDGEIAFMDHHLGALLEAGSRDGWLDNTIIVVLGDHGEGLGQHGMAGHGSVWMEQLRAPLFFVVPGETPRRIPRAVTAVDVLPTLLRFVELPDEEGFLGQVSGVDALSDAPEQPVFSHSSARQLEIGVGEARSVVEGPWHWVQLRGVEHLFHRHDDPHALYDVADLQPDTTARMRALADRMQERLLARGEALGRAPARPAGDALIEELRALGYVED